MSKQNIEEYHYQSFDRFIYLGNQCKILVTCKFIGASRSLTKQREQYSKFVEQNSPTKF